MAEISRRSEPVPQPRRPENRFHLSLFFLLLVACWPFALVYVAKCWTPPACEANV